MMRRRRKKKPPVRVERHTRIVNKNKLPVIKFDNLEEFLECTEDETSTTAAFVCLQSYDTGNAHFTALAMIGDQLTLLECIHMLPYERDSYPEKTFRNFLAKLKKKGVTFYEGEAKI